MRPDRARVRPLELWRAAAPDAGSGLVFCDECSELAVGCCDGAPLCLGCLLCAIRRSRRPKGLPAVRAVRAEARAVAC